MFYYQTEEILLKKKIVGFWIVRTIDQIVNFWFPQEQKPGAPHEA